MVRKYTDKKDANFYKSWDKYQAALIQLRDMQAEAEQDENRYYCRCQSAALFEGKTAEEKNANRDKRFLSTFDNVHGRVYGQDDKTVLPINPKGLIGLELIYRTLMNASYVMKSNPASELPDKLQDGYTRWEPDFSPSNTEYLQRLQKQVSNELRNLQSRKDRGYHMSAPLCEGCSGSENPGEKFDSVVSYVKRFQDYIQLFRDGEIDWPKNAPELFQILPRSVIEKR